MTTERMDTGEQPEDESQEYPVVTEAPVRLAPAGRMFLRVHIAEGETERYEYDLATASGHVLVGLTDKQVDGFREGHRYYVLKPRDLIAAAIDHYEEHGWPDADAEEEE